MVQAANENPISGSAPLYEAPEPLNPEQHGKLGLKRVDLPFAFASHQHFMPLLAGEFAVASLSYPIIFAGEHYAPLAVTGINVGENLFVDPDGSVRPDAYLTAYMRRYPFTVASDAAMGRMIICIDRASELIVENPDMPFFTEQGEQTDYTKNSIAFCQNFETERQKTDSFVQLLRDLDLFEHREAKHTPINADGTTGEPVVIAGYHAISETKLNALPAEKLVELRDMGALGLIYAHLISLWGWDRLIALAVTKNVAKAAQANAKPAKGKA
jgi:hypothetical protein